MSKSTWLHKEWYHLRIRTWLFILAGLALAMIVFGYFFARRQVAEYRPEHAFKVSAKEFFGSAHALGEPVPVDGNKIELLQNGDQIFPAMLEAIRGAKTSVNFEAYIFESDGTGRQFQEALKERARSGVKVRVILDGVGSSTKLKNEDVDALKQAGCEFTYYHPTHSWRVDKLNRRDHRRVLVVDGKIGFIGGVGFNDKWSGHAQDPKHWRDTHARIEGPLVANLQGAFQQHWMNMTKKILTGAEQFPELVPVGKLKAQVTASHSYSIASMPLTQAVAIAAAERRISITNPYCSPTKDQVALLVAAAQRGVNVQLLLPGDNNDQPASAAAGRNSYGDLLRGGVKIYEYQPTMIHQKTLVVDSLFGVIGTSNLDARSARLNEEIDISVYDEGFGKQMEEVFDNDLKQAKPYTLKEFESRGLWERLTETVVAPFRPQM
jgi:cardiolipin synthase